MHIFSDLENDTIRIIKANGAVNLKEYKCNISKGLIQTFDLSIDVTEGDHIERVLPNGKSERYIVLDSQYNAGLPPIPPFYKFVVRNVNSLTNQILPQPTTNIYHLNGNNSRVLHDSIDNSNNTVNVTEQKLFNELRSIIEANVLNQELIPLVNEMESSSGTAGFSVKYNAFIQAAANHMTLFAPFIPALTSLLTIGQS